MTRGVAWPGSACRWRSRHRRRAGTSTSRAAFPELSVFAAIASGDEVERSKPEPDIFLLAARRLGVAPADCTVVEDAPSGVLAARRAGCRVIHVARETTRESTVDGAHATIPTLDALAAHL